MFEKLFGKKKKEEDVPDTIKIEEEIPSLESNQEQSDKAKEHNVEPKEDKTEKDVKPKEEVETKAKESAKEEKKQATKVKKNYALLQDAGKIQKHHVLHPLIKLGSIILKNYRLMIRSRISSLVFFFGPLIIMFLVCVAFNTSSLYGVNIAVYSEEYSELSDSLINNISSKDYYVVKMESQKDCIDSVKFGNFHVCLVFPNKMIIDNSARNKIDIYVDNSRINIANQLTELLSSRVSLQASEVSAGMVSDMVQTISEVRNKAEERKPTIKEFEENNAKIYPKIDQVISQYEDFDFDYTTMSVSEVYDQLNKLKSYCNMSLATGTFNSVTTKVSGLESQYNSVSAKLDVAKTNAENVKSNTATLKEYVKSNEPYFPQIKETLEGITEVTDDIKITKVTSIVTPFQTQVNSINKTRNYLIYLMPPLLVLLIMFSSLLMSSTAIIREKTSSAYFRNFITPTNDGLFMLGQYLTDISIIIVQITIMMGVASYFIVGLTWQTYFLIGLILLILASIFTFLGMILGYLFNTNESVTIGSISMASALLFFSNSILPLETLSGTIRKIVVFNPFVIGERILRRIFIFEAGFPDIKNLFLMLLVFICYLLILAVVAREITKRMSHLSR